MNLCKKCKHHLVLGLLTSTYGELEVVADQEPYVADVEEAVIIDDVEQETIDVISHLGCHICPECGSVDTVWVEEDTSFVEFSPKNELKELYDHIGKKMATIS